MNESLARLLQLDLSGGPLLILTHDNPDPDSLSSAFALRHLLREKRQLDATIGYSGIVGRAENRAMVDLLELDIEKLNESDVSRFAHLALIDAQPLTGNTIIPDDRDVDIVIDHHPLREATTSARFYDVQPRVGASATLLTNYLREAGATIDTRLATALLYGIRTETQDLSREASAEDREAYQFLFPLADGAKLAAIAQPRLSREYYRAVARAMERVTVAKNIAICFIEDSLDPDFVPEMADYLVRMEGLDWILVYGHFHGRLHLSIRTHDENAEAGEAMRLLLREIGAGGGHGMRAGGVIDLQRSSSSASTLHRLIEDRFLGFHHLHHSQLVPLLAIGRSSTTAGET